MIKFEYKFVFVLLCSQLIGCVTNGAYSPLLRAEPEIGSELNRAPRTLRLYFDSLPNVSQSSLRLVGPNGEHQLRGLHTMADNDLMIEIMEPVTVGEYRLEWVTVVENDPSTYSGVFNFTVLNR
jgi:methionine-rich copper-binding protein CopC|tara:strand:- start:974 stop:1345 length:372 start_codon:yes stop_codon:yes gene_type:complete